MNFKWMKLVSKDKPIRDERISKDVLLLLELLLLFC